MKSNKEQVMGKQRRWMAGLALVAVFTMSTGLLAQEAAAPAPGMELSAEAAAAAKKAPENPMAFWNIVRSSGFIGVVLWLGLGACSIAGFALIVDSFISVREKKIVPHTLVEKVRAAMEQGDVVKAIKHCEEEPGPLSSILTSAFANVEAGFEAIQEAVGVSADLESEKLMQRVTYLNVVSSLAPMLGLLGTVQGMIFAFANLATMQAGAAQQQMLAVNIAQALYTTAAGLLAAVPALAFYYFFKNRAAKLILGMEALTMDLIKALRHVEVVQE